MIILRSLNPVFERNIFDVTLHRIRLNLFPFGCIEARSSGWTRLNTLPLLSTPPWWNRVCFNHRAKRNSTRSLPESPPPQSQCQTFILSPSGSALISGIGSNMSLPSCIPQDQEFLPGQTGAGCKTALLNNRNQSGTEKNEHEALKQRPNFLPLAPVGPGCVNALEPMKGERVVRVLENRFRENRFINREICTISMQRSNGRRWMKS